MLKTEMRNPKTTHIDEMSVHDMVKVINEENYNAVKAVEDASPQIEKAINAVVAGLERGGRLFYVGAGTSGRIGVMDAAECPPTYGVDKNLVIGIIAGGYGCMTRAAEQEEDSYEQGVEDVKKYGITANDRVVGVSASGGAAYVIGALEYAKAQGAVTVGVTSNVSLLSEKADIAVITDTGAEVVTGSTRMKAGTAQKLVLNAISTAAMIKTGKVYQNLMINLKPSNKKLKDRMIRITAEILGVDNAVAEQKLEENGWNIRSAVEK